MSVTCEQTYYAKLNDVWTDITGYVNSAAGKTASWGMSSNLENDRLADTGKLVFTLNNDGGLFDPTLATALAGWDIGTKIVYQVKYDNATYVKFYGAVDALDLLDTSVYVRQVKVTVLDWMRYLEKLPVKGVAVQSDKTADVAVNAIIDAVNDAPLAESIDTGEFTFDAIFDTVTTSTTAMTEMNKIVLSEGGYFYKRCDPTYGETLVFENAHHRTGFDEVDKIPLTSTELPALMDENGDELLAENGEILYVDGCEAAVFDWGDIDTGGVSRDYGKNIINRMKFTAYPKRIDTTEQVLYSLDSPMLLGPAETKTFTGKYVNATSKKACNAITSTMIAPVATTDYTMNTKADGTGTDITAQLDITVVYGADAPTYTLTNNSSTAYLTKLQARGYGVYQDNEIYIACDDTDSQNEYGVREMNIQQQYQRDVFFAKGWGDKTICFEKDPRGRLNKITMIAQRSGHNMAAFLNLDVGDVINIDINELSIDGNYYIQGVGFSVNTDNIITFSYILKQAIAADIDISPVVLDFPSGNFGLITYKPIHEINNADITTWIISVYNRTEPIINLSGQIIGTTSGSTTSGGQGILLSYSEYSPEFNCFMFRSSDRLSETKYDEWLFSYNISTNTWYRVACVFDKVNQTLTAYCNGEQVEVYRNDAATGSLPEDPYYYLKIGSVGSNKFFNGLLKDARVYNVGLTADEIAQDYSGTVITRGLQFAGVYVQTKDLTYFTDHELLSTDKLINGSSYDISYLIDPTTPAITTRIP